MKLKTKDIIYIGLIAALCAVATTIRIEVPGGAMVHMGSAVIFTTSIVFGGLYGGLGAAIGSALFDLLGGHTQYLFFSFIIKGICGLLIGLLTAGYACPTSKTPLVTIPRMVMAMVVGALWTAFGYFLAWWFVIGSITVAFTNIQFSVITSATGFIVAILMAPVLQRVFRRNR
mgnify:CR=1 FL=1